MKNTIWKFPLKVEGEQEIEMPRKSMLLTVQVQRGGPCLWALVDPAAPKVGRLLFTHGTGHGVYSTTATYLGTYQLSGGALVFHVFDGGECVLSEEA